MKRTKNSKKKPQKKSSEIVDNKNTNKRTTSILDNNSTLLNFFKLNSSDKSISKKKEPELKNTISKNDNNENNYKIDVSNFILFNENYSEQINKIFTNNFINNFKHYLDSDYIKDKTNLALKQNLNFSKNSFSKFIHQTFNHYITKYLLNNYQDLIYVSEKYILDNNTKADYSEIELLSHNDESNILLEYSPINISESNFFYPELSSKIIKYIKNFRKKKRKKISNHALLLYRPNNDFISFINKIRLICSQMGYNLLIKEDEINKLMNCEKLKSINQNYIIGTLKEKNKKYLQIIENIATTEKWKIFLEKNNINLIEKESTIKNKYISKSQGIKKEKKSLSKRVEQIINKKKENEILSNSLLTFIGRSNSNEIEVQENNEMKNSKEYAMAKCYQQNILKKFNKRKNVILFLDNFEDNEDNNKYVNQINWMIPNSRSPIIILTNNLSLFKNNLLSDNSNYILHQIENEGISLKENLIYMTFLILYFNAFFPKVQFEKQKSKEIKIINEDVTKDNNMNADNIGKDKMKDNELDNDSDFVIHIKDDESEDDEDFNNLNKIIKAINNIFADVDLKSNQNKINNSLLILSYIISLLNNYELDNNLVYLKNLFQYIEPRINNINIKQNPINILSLLQKEILKDIEEYKMDNNDKNLVDDDIAKISEIYDKNSFFDYELGNMSNIAERQYEEKINNFGINKGVDYNKESYFYANEFCSNEDIIKKYNCLSNKEIKNRIIEDHKFFHNYYSSSNVILNYSDIKKLNIILIQIIFNESITLKDISTFIGTRFSKRSKNYDYNNIIKNNDPINEKIIVLNRLFRKCPLELFIKYLNAHCGLKYYIEFTLNNEKFFMPEKLKFFNYFNDYYLMDEIQSKQKSKYSGVDDEEDDDDLNDDESELSEEEEEY